MNSSRSLGETGPYLKSLTLPLLMLAMGLFITYQLWHGAQKNVQQDLRAQFDFNVREITDAVTKRMATYEQVLLGVKGLYEASASVERHEFKSYVASLHLKENYPGVQGVRFSPVVLPAERSRHIFAMRKQGLPDYTIHPAGKRDLYTPVIYVEPYDERNKVIFGYDTYSDLEHPRPGDSGAGLRRAAMEQARDTNRTTISGKIRLVFERDEDAQPAFLMFLPIYKTGLPHDTLEERRANITGWVSLVFRADDLMHGILGVHSKEFDIELYDGKEMSNNSLMHDSNNIDIAHKSTDALFRANVHLDIAGRSWTIAIHTLPEFLVKQNTQKPNIIAYAGAGISSLLALLVLLLTTGRKRALQAAAVIAQESRKNETLLRTANDGIYIIGNDGNVLQANDAFCRMLGYTHDELTDMDVVQWSTRSHINELKQKTTSPGSTGSTLETSYRRRDGNMIDVEVSVSGVEIDGQQLLYCSVRDITERKQSQDELRSSEARYHRLVEQSPDVVYGFSSKRGGVYYSSRVKQVLGYSPEHLCAHPTLWNESIHPEDSARVGQAIREFTHGKAFDIEYRIRDAQGNWLWMRDRSIGRHVSEDEVLIEGLASNITEQKLADEKLRESQQKMHAVIETALDAAVTMDIKGIITGWNVQAEKVFGWPREEAIGRLLHETIIPPRYHEAHVRGVQRFLETGMATIMNTRIEIFALHRDGHEFPVELAIAPIKVGETYEFSGFIRDISNRKKAEEKIRDLAFYDPLTRLPNRRLLLDRLHQALAMSIRSGRQGALMFIDLDNFKGINDTEGHAVGDQLLIEVASRLRACIRDGDTTARMGGDEFVVLLEDLDMDESTAATQAETVGEKIRETIGRPYLIDDHEHYSTASIGMTLFRGPVITGEEMLKRADVALYQAKSAGRNTLRFFDPALQAMVSDRVAMESDLRRAIALEQLLLYYQPQIDSSGRMIGAEALVRWKHPERGMVSPAEFIPLAEESGLILPLGHWVLTTACEQLVAWAAQPETAHLTLAVNVSRRQFGMVTFVEEVLTLVDHFKVNPANLKLEITESMLLDNVDDIIDKMAMLKNRGINFSMDDFGTGYSSLSYLKLLPLYQLKIDQSFVRDVLTDPNDAAIARIIISLGQTLNLKVIAEGVEAEAQREFLELNGCHAFQGYLFSKPVPIEEFARLVVQYA